MPWNWSMKKRKNQFFFLKYFLVDKQANAKKKILASSFLSKNRSKNDFWLWGPWEPGRNDFLKNFNLFHLSYALTTIFIIKVRFPANTDILTYANDIMWVISCENRVNVVYFGVKVDCPNWPSYPNFFSKAIFLII